MRIEEGKLPHWGGAPFNGAKAALICGTDLVALRRDKRPDIPWPGRIDLPGGGREAEESPLQCAIREIGEEIGLALTPERFHWARAYIFSHRTRPSWFVAARIDGTEMRSLRLGDEGLACWMMPIAAFRLNPQVIPTLRLRVSDYAGYELGVRAWGERSSARIASAAVRGDDA